MSSKSFNLYGKKIVISEAYDNYNSIRASFTSEAIDAMNSFMSKYDEYRNIDNFIENWFHDGLEIILEVIDRIVVRGLLINTLKIYDCDVERFFSDFYAAEKNLFVWSDAYSTIEDKYLAIKLNQQQLDEYRKQRRENRGRWVGGGFGVGGAIKGAMKAGAMNMVTGAAHGLFNAGAKLLSSMEESSQKSALYKSKDTKKTLSNGICQSVFNIHYAVANLLNKNDKLGSGRIEYFHGMSEERARAVLNNFSKMNKSDILAILPEIILSSPYDSDVFEKALAIFGDKDNELTKIALYFHRIDFLDVKNEMVEKLFLNVKDKLAISEERALAAKEQFEEASKIYGNIGAREKVLSEIDAVLADYDLKARTVEDNDIVLKTVFKTREEADKARQELSNIKTLLNGLDYEHSETDALIAKSKLEDYGIQSAILSKYLR